VRRDMSLNRECSLYCFIRTAFHRGCRMQTARNTAYRVPTLGRHTTSFVCRHGQNYRWCEVGRSGWPMLWIAKTDLSTREAMLEIRLNGAGSMRIEADSGRMAYVTYIQQYKFCARRLFVRF
jgi:hypothetical protein